MVPGEVVAVVGSLGSGKREGRREKTQEWGWWNMGGSKEAGAGKRAAVVRIREGRKGGGKEKRKEGSGDGMKG